MDFKRIICEAENEKLVQDKEREARARNLIIHGIPEQTEPEESKDTEIVNELLIYI